MVVLPHPTPFQNQAPSPWVVSPRCRAGGGWAVQAVGEGAQRLHVTEVSQVCFSLRVADLVSFQSHVCTLF